MSKPLNISKPQFSRLPNAGPNFAECDKDGMMCLRCLAQSRCSANDTLVNGHSKMN